MSEVNVKANRTGVQNGPITKNELLPVTAFFLSFFYLGFLSQTFTIHRRAGAGLEQATFGFRAQVVNHEAARL